jgi:hypothetical protein
MGIIYVKWCSVYRNWFKSRRQSDYNSKLIFLDWMSGFCDAIAEIDHWQEVTQENQEVLKKR